jgi:V/A-type H+-transporting ATPase subunit I
MVATMKKYLFLAYHKDYKLFLDDLRDLGMIHVVEQDRSEVEEDKLYEFITEKKQLEEAKKILNRVRDKKSDSPFNEADADSGKKTPAEIEKIENEKSLLKQQLMVASKERDTLKPWGNFSPDQIKLLENAGYKINFFISPNNQYDEEWEELYDIYVVNRESSRTYFITLSKDENMAELLNLEKEKLPDVSLDDLNRLIESVNDKITVQEDKLKELSDNIPSVDAAINSLDSNIQYYKVEKSASNVVDEKIMLLQGWAPVDNDPEISKYLESKSVYFEKSDPAPEDDVPIKFKNNRFNKLFEPIAELYELPSYNEIDLTPYFAPFYMIFFGLALGDIGYGAFLLVLATVVKLVKKETIAKSLRGTLTLVQFLGASTMVCGLLQGGFFGISIYEINNPFFKNLQELLYFDNSQMFILSLVLGVIQIMFGKFIMIFNRIKQFGIAHALSSIGWFVFLLSFILAFLLPSMMPMMGTVHKTVMILSGILIVFFNSPGKNPLVNIGTSLWDAYNMATGLLGDVLSYVRLFALGLSGGILASVFSSLATGMSPDNAIVGPIVTVLIFVAGHAINIFMNALGAFVHPLRLTFVEFYNNSDFTGGGKKYNPFRKIEE